MWYYKDKEFTEDDIGDNIGFVYVITNKSTGKKYIGKKLFTFSKTKQVKLKKKKIRVSSDWNTYYGSNDELKEDVKLLGNDLFHREILYLCKSKGTASYWEAYEILKNHAIISDDFYNGWLSIKVSKSHIKPLD